MSLFRNNCQLKQYVNVKYFYKMANTSPWQMNLVRVKLFV